MSASVGLIIVAGIVFFWKEHTWLRIRGFFFYLAIYIAMAPDKCQARFI
jgi:uncharacterized membrane protein SirB2